MGWILIHKLWYKDYKNLRNHQNQCYSIYRHIFVLQILGRFALDWLNWLLTLALLYATIFAPKSNTRQRQLSCDMCWPVWCDPWYVLTCLVWSLIIFVPQRLGGFAPTWLGRFAPCVYNIQQSCTKVYHTAETIDPWYVLTHIVCLLLYWLLCDPWLMI